jgi:DNA-binding MarR family transcriptional regulator
MPIEDVDSILAAWRRELPAAVGPRSEPAKLLLIAGRRLGDAMAGAAAEHGLTVAEHDVLATLRRQGKPFELTPGRLSAELLLTTGGTSNVLRRLEERGLVRRATVAGDGRARSVRLSAAGARLAEAAVRRSSEAQAEVLARLGDAESARLVKSLRKIAP